ncbi:MAG: hypothetical protein HUJ56_02410 [Erysipelotrichaceae bacterium]|nr:hypothetical protein [Erysipelotrichaceae bacterium]
MVSAIIIFLALCLLIILQVNDFTKFQKELEAVQASAQNKLVASPLPGYYKPFMAVMMVVWALVAILYGIGVIPSYFANKWFFVAVAACLAIEFVVLFISAESRLCVYYNDRGFFYQDRVYPFKSLLSVSKVKGKGFNMRQVEVNTRQYLYMSKNAADFLETKIKK